MKEGWQMEAGLRSRTELVAWGKAVALGTEKVGSFRSVSLYKEADTEGNRLECTGGRVNRGC